MNCAPFSTTLLCGQRVFFVSSGPVRFRTCVLFLLLCLPLMTSSVSPHTTPGLCQKHSSRRWPFSLTQPGRYSCWHRCTRPWPPKSVADARRIACCSPPVLPNQWHPLPLGSRKQPSWDSWETGCCCRRLFGLRSGHSLQTARAVRPYAHRRRAAGHAGYSASICYW